jgi:hypothetical protein
MIKFWILIGLVLFAAGFIILQQHRAIQKIEIENTSLQQMILPSLKIIESKSGKEMSTTPVAGLSQETLRAVIKLQLDSLKSEFRVNFRSIEQYQRIQTQTIRRQRMPGKDTLIVVYRNSRMDTIPAKIFRGNDNYFSTESLLMEDTLNTRTKVRQDLQVVIQKGKREKWWKFWKKRPIEGQLFTSDTGTHVKDFKVLKVIQK